MTKLYIANCSKQVHHLVYRAPGQDRLASQDIAPGTQQVVWKETSREDLDFIIEQHLPYGLRPASEVMNSHQFIGLCFQFDKPIDVDKIVSAYETNDSHLKKRGEEIRKETASAMSHDLADKYEGNLKSIEVIEEDKGGDSVTSVNETIQLETVRETRGRGRPRKG